VVSQAVSKKENTKNTSQSNKASTALIKISIIIPVFNEFPRVEALLQSLQRFRSPNVEVIIVDGGSDDGTDSCCRALEGRLVDKVLQN